MGRAPCCEKVGLKRGPWTPEEDQKLITYINENGHGSWRALPKRAGLLRCGKSCRLRWTNYLRPDIKRGDFSLSEEQSIIQLHALLGNRWSAIASHLPKRTDNEIKNYWNTHLKKKLMKMGLDPVTHKSKADNTLMSNNAIPEETADMDKIESNVKDKIDSSDGGVRSKIFMLASSSTPSGSSITNHMAQWESARLEAEARLAQESQLRSRGLWSPRIVSPNPLNVAPLSAYSPWSGAKTFRSSTNNGSVCADACKALNAVELFHALHNWEKSLQGQAGIMWPEAWQHRNLQLPLPEVQAESSSCSSPCSDANTNAAAATATATTAIRSPSINAATNGMDHSSPTSTLCSFDSFSLKQKGMQPPFAGVTLPGLQSRRLSWNDALSASMAKPPMPPRYSQQGVNCKFGEDSSTFSSLMQDAIMSVDAMASAFTCSQEDGAEKSKAVPVTDDDVSCVKDEEFSCDKLSFMVGDLNSSEEEKNGNLHATYEDEATTDNEQSMNNTLIGGEEFANKDDPDGKLSDLILPSDPNLEVGDVRDEFKECKDIKTGIIKACDILDAHDVQNASTGAELMNAEMFKDLPKLKSEASTISHLSSLPALLGDDISDYWSSIMLKEPSLQHVEMTF